MSSTKPRLEDTTHTPRIARDVSATLSANGIGWSVWDYAGSFAVAVKDESGVRVPDHEVVAALGLAGHR